MSLYKAFTASENTEIKDSRCRYDWRTTSRTLLPYEIIYMKCWSLNTFPVQCKSILPKALKTNPLLLCEAVLKEVIWRKDQYLLTCVCKPTLIVYENKNSFIEKGALMQVITGLAQAVLHCKGLGSVMSHTQCSFRENVQVINNSLKFAKCSFLYLLEGQRLRLFCLSFFLGGGGHHTNSWSSSDRSQIE